MIAGHALPFSEARRSMSSSREPACMPARYPLAFDNPLIATINGAAARVGLCPVLYCDLRFVSNAAKLTTPFARPGLVAEPGLAWLLPCLVGPMHAADLLPSGRTVTGEYASGSPASPCTAGLFCVRRLVDPKPAQPPDPGHHPVFQLQARGRLPCSPVPSLMGPQAALRGPASRRPQARPIFRASR